VLGGVLRGEVVDVRGETAEATALVPADILVFGAQGKAVAAAGEGGRGSDEGGHARQRR